MRPLLLTSLLLAADRVDSTTGLQMAFLKQWAPRSHRDLALQPPVLAPGAGSHRGGRCDEVVDELPHVDLAYLDPPYNQHRYFTNYHVWETLVRWDAPEHYGIACKRIDARDPATKSVFNRKAEMPVALRDLVQRVRADVVVLSYNDEAWIGPERLVRGCARPVTRRCGCWRSTARGTSARRSASTAPPASGSARVSHLRNTELVFVAGPRDRVEAAVHSQGVASPQPTGS